MYVYGKNKRSYKYLLFTHKIPEGQADKFDELTHNIDPKKDGVEKTYVKKKFSVDRYNAFDEAEKRLRIHRDDREKIKKYKK